MPTARLGSKLGIHVSMWHEDKDGYLVYGEIGNRAQFTEYDIWRSLICHRFRHGRRERLRLEFRRGDMSFSVLFYAWRLHLRHRRLIKWLQEVQKNGTS